MRSQRSSCVRSRVHIRPTPCGHRSTSGDIKSYPVVQTMHQDSILALTEAPADVAPAVAEVARELARDAVGCLSGAGIFGCAVQTRPVHARMHDMRVMRSACPAPQRQGVTARTCRTCMVGAEQVPDTHDVHV
jgi:hypothetical protein